MATTKAYSAQLVAMYCLAVQFARVKNTITEVMQFIKYSKDTEKLSQLPRLHPSFWIVYQNWNTAAMTQSV